MKATWRVLIPLLAILPRAGYAGEQARVDESVTLETLRQRVARNEKLIDPIKLSYTVKFSRTGERPRPSGMRGPGRPYSHCSSVWAQSGSKQYVRLDCFFGPNEPASSSLVVFDADVKTAVKLPDKTQCTIADGDQRDWFDVFAARLRLRPFENQYLLSEVLVPVHATLGRETEVISDRPAYVVDMIQPDLPSNVVRLWIDAQAAIPLRTRIYDRHPTAPQARLILEVNDVTPYRLPNGGWIPVTGVRTLHFSGSNPPYSGSEHFAVEVDSITTQVPDSLFALELPVGARIYNDTSGLTTVQGQALKSYEEVVRGTGTYVGGTAIDSKGVPVPGVVAAPTAIRTYRAEGGTSRRLIQTRERTCAMTDMQGRFALELEEQGSYGLTFYSADFVDQTVREVPLGEHNLKVTLERGGTVAGRAFFVAAGRRTPLTDAEVIVQAGDPIIASTMRYSRTRTTTDAQGRFEIRCLPTQMRDRSVPRSEPPRYIPLPWAIRCGPAMQSITSVTFESEGDRREVELVLKPDIGAAASLVGRPMPELTGLGLDLRQDDIKGKSVLVCFFDMEQRPARNCAEELAQRVASLRNKGVAVLGVQEKGVDADRLGAWMKQSGITFPVGIITSDPDDVKFAWSVRSLPWLILTDAAHVIRAEGFTMDDLDAKTRLSSGGKPDQ